MMRIVMLLCAVCPLSGASADVVVAAPFTDHMVLQRRTDAPIRGWASPGERVVIEGSWGARTETIADDRGRWRGNLPTPGAGGPYSVQVQGASSVVVLDDVLIGEVWLCSGQSNMEMPIGNIRPGYTGVENAESEIEAATWPEIRLLTVPNVTSLHARADIEMSWAACTPETARTFSATAYFFARELQQELGVPIGVISADWGGTRIEAWMSPEALAPFEAYASTLEHLSLLADVSRRRDVAESLEAQWWDRLDAQAPGRSRWREAGVDVSSWGEMTLPSTLDGELADFDGIVFLRRTVVLDDAWDGAGAVLSLGPIDDMDDAWVNGVHVGSVHESGRWNEPREYAVPRGVLRAGENTIAVRMYDTSGPGGVNGEPNQLVLRSEHGTTPLAGSWRWAKGAAASALAPMASAEIHANTPTVLYHGLIEPLAPMAIAGAIWYQGESNRGNAAVYDRLMAAMIGDWRMRFERTFPFYYVQIAPFGYGNDRGQTAALREAQRRALAIDGVGMVVTTDIGDERDIHPRNKQEVGRRLALLALNRTYGRDVACAGPSSPQASVVGEAIRVAFEHAEELSIEAGTSVFEVAAEDGVFHAATIEVAAGAVIVNTPASVVTPRTVRYGWSPTATATLFNGAGLPASPFMIEIER